VRRFLLDASALVQLFVISKTGTPENKTKSAISKLLSLRKQGKAELLVPNLCMAECSKSFAKLAYEGREDHNKAGNKYRALVDSLVGMVSKDRGGLIQSFPLERRHLVDIEDIFTAEYRIPSKRDTDHLSGVDAIIIAMGGDLARKHGMDNVFVVTQDRWLATVCNRSHSRPVRAIYTFEDPIPDGI